MKNSRKKLKEVCIYVVCLMAFSLTACKSEEETVTAGNVDQVITQAGKEEKETENITEAEDIENVTLTENAEESQGNAAFETEERNLIKIEDLFDDNVFPTACAENVFGKGNYLIDQSFISSISFSSICTLEGFAVPLNICVQAVCRPMEGFGKDAGITTGKVYYINNAQGKAEEVLDQYDVEDAWLDKMEELAIPYQVQDISIDGTLQECRFTLENKELNYIFLVKFDEPTKGIISAKTVN